MALFVYSKNTISTSGGYYYVSWGPSTSYPAAGYQYIGYSSYSINSSTGVISYSGAGAIDEHYTGTVYDGSSSSVTRWTSSGGRITRVTGDSTYMPASYRKGSFIEHIVAEEGTYPDNGSSGGYWYVKERPAQNPSYLIPNGGESWNGVKSIGWDVPAQGLNYKVELSLNNGQTWSIIDNGITASSTSFDFSTVAETSLAKVRVSAYDGALFVGQVESAGVFTIQHNVAPNAPSTISPKGTIVDRTIPQELVWRHNDPNPNDLQSAATVRWRAQGDATWTTVNIVGQSQRYVFSANTLPAGNIEWMVQTADQQGLTSPWSSVAVFSAAEPTNTPTIIQPGDTVSVARPVIQWASGAQQMYQIVVEDSLGAIVWDTGNVISTAKARTIGVDLVNGGRYRIKVRIMDGGGLYSSYAIKDVLVSYTPPAKPVVNAYSADGFIAFNIESPQPTGTQPTVESYDVFKMINNQWVRVAFNVITAFNDYHVKSGESYRYYFKALGDNGTTSTSDSIVASTTFSGAWIHAVRDAELTLFNFKYNGTGYEKEYEPDSAVMQFAGRRSPVVRFGPAEEHSLTVRIQSREGMEDMDVLRRFVNARETVCYRDEDGNLLVGHILNLRIDKNYRVSSANVTFLETDFNEEV
ncbi:fibronectin type III domain-containing protein [Sporosarcina sp. ITBMC105]